MNRETKPFITGSVKEIPTEWKTPKIKNHAEFINGDRSSNYPSGDDIKTDGVCFLTTDNIHGMKVDIGRDKTKYITDEKYKAMRGAKLQLNDIVYCLRGSIGECAINKVLNEGTVASSLTVIRPKESVNPDFLNYYLHSAVVTQQNDNYMNGTCAANLAAESVGNYYLLLPDISEQRAIVRYLDAKCAAINDAIGRHKKSIEKLEEYKKAIISDAVIRGINPQVTMKESGISGIGMIPSHYLPTRVKFLGTYRNGLTYSPTDVCDKDEGILVLRSSNIQNGKIVLEDNVYVNCPVDNRLMVQNGDILICARNGSAKLVGKSAIIEDIRATYGAFMMVLRTTAVPKYMYYVLNSYVMDIYRASFSTTTVNQLTAGILGNMVIPYCVDKNEQYEIACYLDNKCSKIDFGIKSHQDIIDKLEEYRKSIIYNAVTGKIDCRTERSQ